MFPLFTIQKNQVATYAWKREIASKLLHSSEAHQTSTAFEMQ